MGRKGHRRNDPPEGFELSQCWAFLDTLRTIRCCCSRTLLRCGRRVPKIKGQVALVFETPQGRYGSTPCPMGVASTPCPKCLRPIGGFQPLRCGNGKATDAFTRQRPHRYEGGTVSKKHDRSKALGIWGRPTQRKKRVDYRQND